MPYFSSEVSHVDEKRVIVLCSASEDGKVICSAIGEDSNGERAEDRALNRLNIRLQEINKSRLYERKSLDEPILKEYDKEIESQADKVKWVYLKPNPYQIEALAFFEFDMPEKIRIFLEEYADRKKIFDSILLNKLEGFYSDLEWNLNLNPYINQFFEL